VATETGATTVDDCGRRAAHAHRVAPQACWAPARGATTTAGPAMRGGTDRAERIGRYGSGGADLCPAQTGRRACARMGRRRFPTR